VILLSSICLFNYIDLVLKRALYPFVIGCEKITAAVTENQQLLYKLHRPQQGTPSSYRVLLTDVNITSFIFNSVKMLQVLLWAL
jgi:hypothetical protein